jgi:DNA-binding CsgD family transcriptional regulator
MVASRHTGANLGPQKEVATGHRDKIPLSSGVAPSLEVLIRKLVAEARSGPDVCADVDDHREGQVIVDAEVDGVRCLLTWLERYPPSQISFSPRESEIARMVAKGYPNKTIAAILEISSWTVCTHLRRMFAKLGVSSRAAMVARMMDSGMLSHASER